MFVTGSGAWMRLAIVACASLIVLSACRSGSPSRAQLESPYPLDRVRAAVHAAERGDAGAVDLLIERLEDHDRGVRMYAILALERLCGTDYGYVYYASEIDRGRAVQRWRDARARGEVVVRRPASNDRQNDVRQAATGS